MKTNLFFKQLLGTLIFFTFIFIGSGTLNYWQAWLYIALGIVMMILGFTVLKIDQDLQKERAKPGEGAKKWDKNILLLSFLSTIGMYLTAGLDSGRYHLTPEFPIFVYIIGFALTAAGQLIFLIAQKQNKFFSSTVRIQTDRGHSVCDTGLYSIVRHPAYMGNLIQAIGFPLIFGSYWSWIPVGISIVLLIIRTLKEDTTLKAELNGYEDYSRKVRFRLIPFIF